MESLTEHILMLAVEMKAIDNDLHGKHSRRQALKTERVWSSATPQPEDGLPSQLWLWCCKDLSSMAHRFTRGMDG